MTQQRPDEDREQEKPQQRPALPTGSTRFRNTDYAEQRENWPDEDDRR